MVLCHIIDDFVLQKATLCDLKQKEWWERNCGTKEYGMLLQYKNDYKMALFIHALSWSIMIHLPLFLIWIPWWALGLTVGINAVIHYITDDHKANKKTINLIQDQLIHLGQILITFGVYYLCVI